MSLTLCNTLMRWESVGRALEERWKSVGMQRGKKNE